MSSEYYSAIYNLLIVIAVAVFLLMLLKKFKTVKFHNTNLVRILQILPLGNKEKVILIEAHNTCILLGATTNQITTLHVFAPIESEEIMQHNVSVKKPKFSLNNIDPV